jgi:uncharacterized protein (UPF0261 family)
MVSTMASGDVSGYIGASDIAIMNSVTDISGLNRISRKVLKSAANQIAGAVVFSQDDSEAVTDKPAIGLTMFGVTTPCVQQLTQKLENDYDCLVFHATGSGGKAMEKLADNHYYTAYSISVPPKYATTYLAAFWPVVMTASARSPALKSWYIGSCGALDMVNFGSRLRYEHYQGRRLYQHNPQVTLMRTTPEENGKMGTWIAERLNRCEGEVRFAIPMGGFSALDNIGGDFWDPEADQAFLDAFKATFIETPHRKLIVSPHHINSAEFNQLLINLHKN